MEYRTMIPETKVCGLCKLELSKDNYTTRIMRGKPYLQSFCTPCVKIDRKARYKKNKKRENHNSKLWSFRNGGKHRHESYYVSKVEDERAKRLAVRLARANLIIELCMSEWEIANREELNGRMLLSKHEECATMATWLIRSRTLLGYEAISELFNCAVGDTVTRLKTAKVEHSFYQGDILIRMHCAKVMKKYDKAKPKHWKDVEVLSYYDYTPAQREPRELKKYVTPKAPPENIELDMVMDIICWYYNVDWENFLSDDGTRGNLSKARQVCMYIMNKHLGMGLSEIAKMFDRHHSTACHGVKAGFDFIRCDKGNLYYEMHRRFSRMENQTCPGEQMIS